ncbi:unnamed protein product [Urochloa humidicola]
MRRLKLRPWFSLPQLVAVSTTAAPAPCSSKGSPFGCSGRAGDIAARTRQDFGRFHGTLPRFLPKQE